MPIDIKIPSVGESITEVEILSWKKGEGDTVAKDETIAELETDKVTVELPAPADGTLSKIMKQEGDTAEVGEVVAELTEGDGDAAKEDKAEKKPKKEKKKQPEPEPEDKEDEPKQDEQEEESSAKPESKSTKPEPRTPKPEPDAPDEKRVNMSPLRRRIAERLVEAQQQAALLTTFNEADLSQVIALRKQYGEHFKQQYDVKLGFMSFFVKAVVHALRAYPRVNAAVDGEQIVYHNRHDIGIAVSTEKGLVVPILRDAGAMSFADTERAIADFAERARDNKLTIDELEGGTFTITNGGVFGSLLSTPIINPPQSGVLGMHTIQDRPVAVDGQVVIRPMMYLALTYDHRLVDGREAVSFLNKVKESVEQPSRMLIGA